ncbi:MAG: EF-hand domain-containing protein [Thalassovita sp.]
MKRAFVITALTAIVVAGTAITATAKGGMDRRGGAPHVEFSELDMNGDGVLSQDELAAHFKSRFVAIDTDSSGTLSEEELKAAAEAQMAERKARNEERQAKRFAKLIEHRDANGDGVLSLDEMEHEKADKLFSRLDKDSDGTITQEEFDAAAKMRPGHGKRGNKNGRGPATE